MNSRQLAAIATCAATSLMMISVYARFYDTRDTNLLSEVIWQNDATSLTRGDLYRVLYAEDWDPGHQAILDAFEAADTEILTFLMEVQEKETRRSSVGRTYGIMTRMEGDVSAALPQARRHLQAADFMHRESAIGFLAKRGTPDDHRRVVGMIRDENALVALAAARAVGDMQDPLLLDAAEIALQERIASVDEARAKDVYWDSAVKALAEARKQLEESGARPQIDVGTELPTASATGPEASETGDVAEERAGPDSHTRSVWPLVMGAGVVVLLAILLVGCHASRRRSADKS